MFPSTNSTPGLREAGGTDNSGQRATDNRIPATTDRPWPRDRLSGIASLSCLTAPTTTLLDLLDGLGTPMWCALPGGKEFLPPRGWQHLDATGNRERMSAWRPGMALCGRLSTSTFGLVDVDTKNGATLADAERFCAMVGVAPWCTIRTPSGGWHLYVPAHPDARDYPADGSRHFPGLPGVEFYGRAHFAYLPGTSRPKYDGAGYEITGGDPTAARGDSGPLWAVLARLDAARRQTPPPRRDSPRAVSRPLAGQEGGRAQRYTDTVLHSEMETLSATAEGGRNMALFTACLKLGSRTLLPLDEVERACLDACRVNGLLGDDGAHAVCQTIRSGFERGRRDPRPTPANTPEERTGQHGGRGQS
jgi:hypothetical protein